MKIAQNKNHKKSKVQILNETTENQFLSYLRQLAKENLSQNLEVEPELFQTNEISSLKDYIIQNLSNSTQFNFDLKDGVNQIKEQLKQFDEKIEQIQKKLNLFEDQPNLDDKEIQIQRKHFFQNENKILLPTQFQQPKQTKYNYIQQQDQSTFSGNLLINSKILKFSNNHKAYDSFDFNNRKENPFDFYMMYNCQDSIPYLIQQDLYLKTSKNYLRKVKMMHVSLTNIKSRVSLLGMFRLLISVKCNILYICDFIQQQKNKQAKDLNEMKNSEVFELLDEIYQVCLQNNNLQSLTIPGNNSVCFDSFLSAMTNVELKLSNICFLQLNIANVEVEEQQIQILFNCLAQLSHLQHLNITNLKLGEQETLNNMNHVLKRLKYINMSFQSFSSSVDAKFEFEKAEFLILTIKLEQSQLTKKQQLNLMASLSRAKNLISIDLNVSSIQDQNYYNQQVSQNTNNNDNNNKKESKNDKKQNKKQKQNSAIQKEQKEGEGEENYEIDDQDLLDLFESKNTILESYQVKIKYNPLIFKILVLQLKNTSDLYQMKMDFSLYQFSNYKTEKNQNKQLKKQEQEFLEIDFSNLFYHLNMKQKIIYFQLQHELANFCYNKQFKDLDLFNFTCKINSKNTESKQVLLFRNQFFFSFDKVKRISINSPFDIHDLMNIDQLCQSFSKCPQIESITIDLFDDQESKICREKQNFNYQNIKFFKRLSDLKYLSNLSLNVPINQNILDSLEDFLNTSKSLKQINVSRNLYYYQQETDYTNFFQSISKCKTLQSITLNFQIEQIKIYQEVSLDTYEEQKLNLFYQPFSDFILSTKGRAIHINYIEDILDKNSFEVVLRNLKKQQEIVYVQFADVLIKQISEHKNLKQLIEICIQQGKIGKFSSLPFFTYFTNM